MATFRFLGLTVTLLGVLCATPLYAQTSFPPAHPPVGGCGSQLLEHSGPDSDHSATDMAAAVMAFCHANQLVALDFDETSYEHSAELEALVRSEWRSLEQYLTRRLSKEGKTRRAERYAALIDDLDSDLDSFTVPLSKSSTLVAVNQGYIGHLMIFTRGTNGVVRLWHIDAQAQSAATPKHALDCWTTDADRPCFVHAIKSFPVDAGGAPRFYIEAGYAQVMGGTRGSQLSVWRWDGRSAVPLSVSAYASVDDATGQAVSVDGDELSIVAKDRFNAFWSCGSCDGRKIRHLLRVTPDDRVVDLGSTSVIPELDLVDEIYTDIRDNKPTGMLVSASALAVMQRSWQPMKSGTLKSLFLNAPSKVEHRGDRTLLCFHANYDFERTMSPVLFTIAQTGRHLRILAAQQDSPDCVPDSYEQRHLMTP